MNVPVMDPIKDNGQVRRIIQQRFELLDSIFLRKIEHKFLLHLCVYVRQSSMK